MPLRNALVISAAFLGLPVSVSAAPESPVLLWGDTHVHTSYSFDAYMAGNVSADPETAYRFAKGAPVLHPASGAWVRIDRPLDFLVVADHAEMLGLSRALGNGDPRLTATPVGQRLSELLKQRQFREALATILEIVMSPDPRKRQPLDRPEIFAESWAHIADAAERNDEPGRFTALIGWEWTSMPASANLHRVVFTSAPAETAKRFLPFGAHDSEKPEDLWAWLERTQKQSGAEFVSIPHNSNVSKGLMFAAVDSSGKALTKSYANVRARWEPVAEVTQTKGTSETHPLLSPDDEFADFEFFPSLLEARQFTRPTTTPADYLRGALRRGLELDRRLGINPFKLGMIGSTDAHTGLASAEESAYLGKLVAFYSPAERQKNQAWAFSASGLAAVWAAENTREAIMAAFKRREVYGTTGPRIALRFFGGFDFAEADIRAEDLAAVGYRRGVPMGGDLTRAPEGRAPSFLIQAVKDPTDGNLDRVQVVKGWLDGSGKSQEKVYDVAWAGERKPGADGRLPPIGNTVDLKTARYTNTIGAVQLSTVWSDPDFDPQRRAFYYVRVLQIPTPRNTLYDALALGIGAKETGYPATIQERAYSSPIWYTPPL